MTIRKKSATPRKPGVAKSPSSARTPATLSAFGDKSEPPTEAALRRALGDAAPAWRRLIAEIERAQAPVAGQWNFAGARFGWSLRLKRGDRVILYLTPQPGRFLAGIVLGGKAVAAAAEAGLPAAVREALAAAPRYAEGTGLRLPVAGESDLPAILRLVELKMAPGR